jgi:hypothetical protein
MKSNMVKQQLNQAPIIFLKQNKLNTITPALVGFFTNVSPRAANRNSSKPGLRKLQMLPTTVPSIS